MVGNNEKFIIGETIAGIESRAKYAVSQAQKNSENILATKLLLIKRIDSLEREIAEMKSLINHHINQSERKE